MATTTGIGVSQTIAIDLAKPGIPKMVYAMQGEGYTRTVSLKIFDGGVQWTPPSDAAYQVSYCKPDGKGGTYSSYTTDSSKPAVVVSDGRLNVVLIPQMLQVAGRVRVEVHMQHAAIMAYAERLSTFTFYIMVQASAESGITSVDYWESDKTDKVVMLTTEIGATANVATTHNVSEFVATPRVGDAVVGSDGYVGKVTAASGTSVTIVSTGALWADLSGTGNAVPLPTYNMPEVGSVVQVKELDASGNPKSWRYSKMASVCFTNEADIPTTPGTAVQLVGLAWYPDDPKLGELAVGKNGYTGEVTAVDDENGPTVTATGNRIFTFAASDITYSGTVGGQAVANVKAALDGLAIGKPLDMTADYVASGAATVAAWATMAKVVNGVASMTEYRVAPGHYTIIPPDGNDFEAREVVIYPPNVGQTDRAVEVHWYSGDDRFFGIEAYTTIEPGNYYRVVHIDAENNKITLHERLVSLPYYRNDTSADEGKILKIVKNGNEYTPAWVTLPTYDGGVS